MGKIVRQTRDIYLKTVTRNLRRYILRMKFYEFLIHRSIRKHLYSSLFG